jgi:hypothetical protein
LRVFRTGEEKIHKKYRGKKYARNTLCRRCTAQGSQEGYALIRNGAFVDKNYLSNPLTSETSLGARRL